MLPHLINANQQKLGWNHFQMLDLTNTEKVVGAVVFTLFSFPKKTFQCFPYKVRIKYRVIVSFFPSTISGRKDAQ
jgi:hypothetical protein